MVPGGSPPSYTFQISKDKFTKMCGPWASQEVVVAEENLSLNLKQTCTDTENGRTR